MSTDKIDELAAAQATLNGAQALVDAAQAAVDAAEHAKSTAAAASGSMYLGHVGEAPVKGKDFQ